MDTGHFNFRPYEKKSAHAKITEARGFSYIITQPIILVVYSLYDSKNYIMILCIFVLVSVVEWPCDDVQLNIKKNMLVNKSSTIERYDNYNVILLDFQVLVLY